MASASASTKMENSPASVTRATPAFTVTNVNGNYHGFNTNYFVISVLVIPNYKHFPGAVECVDEYFFFIHVCLINYYYYFLTLEFGSNKILNKHGHTELNSVNFRIWIG